MGWKAITLVTLTFTTAAITTGLTAKFIQTILGGSKTAGICGGLTMMWLWWRLFGGIRGLNRALGDGSLSLTLNFKNNTNNNGNIIRIICISDTHNRHEELTLLLLEPADVLIHAGDFTMHGTREEMEKFITWFEKLPYKTKLLTCGNHDKILGKLNEDDPLMIRMKSCCIFLSDQPAIIANGKIKIYGTGRTSWISKRSAMYLQFPPEDMGQFWTNIPNDTDIIITHQPPYLHGDRIFLGKNVGCKFLLQRILEIKPKLVVCGHIHEGYGTSEMDGIKFVNAASCNLLYKPLHPPVVVDLPIND
jgi:Icc-related predicted phosphoesterase